MQNKGILISNRRCPICLSVMNIVKDPNKTDKLIWRYQKHKPPHDIKINLRKDQIFEGLLEKIQILYFVTFFCFTENMSLNEAFDRCNTFSSKLEQYNISKEAIIKIFGKLKSFKNKDSQITDYLEGWLCYSLLILDFKRKKLNWSSRINELCKYLIIN